MIHSREELQKLKNEYKRNIILRDGADGEVKSEDARMELMICRGTGCTSSQSDYLLKNLEEGLKERNIDDVKVHLVGCFGFCGLGPIVHIMPDNISFIHVKPEDAEEIIEEFVIGGNLIERLLYEDPETKERISNHDEMAFYNRQEKISLRNVGRINPENIEDYIAYDGYDALANAILEQTPKDVIEEVKAAEIRGRGGAGFPAGRKWETAYLVDRKPKYVICNADEGDPGAFMDCSILEGDPHSVLEAMAISGYAIGSEKGYIYCRAEYPTAIHRLEIAIREAKERGLLGKNILGSDFSFDIEIRLGAGAFVCGEGTALMESIEGKRGMPRTKIHRTAHYGLWQQPTIINNVETFANIPYILQKGAKHFRGIGTEKSPGTKVFSIGGNIENNGLIEVPMGTSLREIVFDIAGGIPNGKAFKAVQTGGPSGGCIPEEHIDTPVDFESLGELGSIMGSGGMIVLDEDNCMVDVARFFLDFTVDESCGKCTPCRDGTKRMLEILEKITEGKGEPEDIDRLEELAEMIIDSSLCGLGTSAPNPVLSTLRFFRDEYEAHCIDKKCPAGACQALISYYIDDTCIGCTRCKRECPVDAISGEVRELHVIDQDKCIQCGACQDVCPTNSIYTK